MNHTKNNTSLISIQTIDLSKLLFSYIVIAIHTGLHFNNSYIQNMILFIESLSVPFFFAISGYLICKDVNFSVNRSVGGVNH